MTIEIAKNYRTVCGYKVSVLTTTAENGEGKTKVVALAHVPPEGESYHWTDLVIVTDLEGVQTKAGISI